MNRYLQALATLVVLGGVIFGGLNYFATKSGLAATNLRVQQIVTQDRIAWLEQQITAIQNEYGNPPKNCPDWILGNWKKFTKELEQKYEILKEIDKRLIK